MRAFVIRPFRARNGIDFKKVEDELIQPAFLQLGIQGSTTEVFLQSGNIREDMFEQLLVADLVVADVSVHNANVFYELGVRHALQPRLTFLLRAEEPPADGKEAPQTAAATKSNTDDEVPFDIRTDRYLTYDPANPAARVQKLVDALRQTVASVQPDSPVFQMLPGLQGHERSRFVKVPEAFAADVVYAAKKREVGKLGLLAAEALAFPWGAEGLRIAGREQYEQEVYFPAKRTWEELFRLNSQDREANVRLGIINYRLGDLDASDQALGRVVNDRNASAAERSEAMFHMANNIRERWRLSWIDSPPAESPAKALASPLLIRAYERFRQAYEEDLNNYKAGLQALSILTIALELKNTNAGLWEERFDPDETNAMIEQRSELTTAVRTYLRAARERQKAAAGENPVLEIDGAHFEFLTNKRATRVQFAYDKALSGVSDYLFESACAQLQTFERLAVLAGVLPKSLGGGRTLRAKQRPARVILFGGEPITGLDNGTPRLTETMAQLASVKIKEILKQEKDRTDGDIVAVASGASGGDIVFHESCAELGIPSRLFLPVSHDVFRTNSVSPAGRQWEERFDLLLKRAGGYGWLADSESLPMWLSTRKDYTLWQRGSLWLIHEALAFGARNLTIVTLLEEEQTRWYRKYVADYGAALISIRIADLQQRDSASATSSG